jgi:sugar-specific transcriptional regulator TrmB
MDKNTLVKIGLSEGEAAVYLTLLENGESPATLIAQKAGLKRPTTYNVLASLIEKNLVQEVKKGKVARFRLQHPVKLKEYFEKIAANAEFAQKILSASLNDLTSQFNLVNNRPGIQYLEGKEGVRQLLEDLLTSKTDIFLYADFDAIQKYIPDIQEEYARRQKARAIVRKAIMVHSAHWERLAHNNRNTYNNTLTPTKYIGEKIDPFHAVMEIYDGKVAYITLTNNGITTTIIRDPHIYRMHAYLFTKLWESLPKA